MDELENVYLMPTLSYLFLMGQKMYVKFLFLNLSRWISLVKQ